jgi:ribosomal protein S18 acetylase RimI-like enzyme
MQRGGAGKALMAALEDDARGAGLTEVTLSVSVPSKRFYEDRGYEITEIRSRDLGDGQFLEFWKARKRL